MKSSRLKAHLNAAKGYAELSKAKRLKVGAVCLKEDRIISIGYNGTPTGFDNECEYIVVAPDGNNVLHTKDEVCHAEMNLIAFAARFGGTGTDGCSVVVTHSPCFECSKLLKQAGIKEIYYETEYRVTKSLEFLRKGKIKVEKI